MGRNRNYLGEEEHHWDHLYRDGVTSPECPELILKFKTSALIVEYPVVMYIICSTAQETEVATFLHIDTEENDAEICNVITTTIIK